MIVCLFYVYNNSFKVIIEVCETRVIIKKDFVSLFKPPALPSSIDPSTVPPANDDGEIDFIEASLATGAAHYDKDGKIVFTNYKDACYANDLTRIGYDQLILKYGIELRLICGDIDIAPFDDKILYMDTDGDGIANKWDASPDIPINGNYKSLNNIDEYNIDDLISDEYNEIIRKADESYDSKDKDWKKDLKTKFLNYCLIIGGYTPFSTTVLNKSFAFGATPFGSNSLNHYLQNNGDDLYIPLNIPLGLSCTQRIAYYKQMNDFFTMVEKTVKSGKKYSFVTIPNTNGIWFVDYHKRNAITKQVAEDWWLTFGGARNALIAEVYFDGKTEYHAKIKYYVYDFYDWNEKDLADVHKHGKAKSFRTIGCSSFEISWRKEARYPETTNVSCALDATEFQGIDDHYLLKNAFDYGIDYYDRINGFIN